MLSKLYKSTLLIINIIHCLDTVTLIHWRNNPLSAPFSFLAKNTKFRTNSYNLYVKLDIDTLFSDRTLGLRISFFYHFPPLSSVV